MEKQEKKKFNQVETEIDLMELLYAIRRHIVAVIVCVLLCAVMAATATKMLITPMYNASSQIYVFTQTTSVTSLADLQIGAQLASDFQILGTSRPVIERVIKKLNLDTTYEAVAGSIRVENLSNSRILKITATNADPQLAADISNAMAQSLSTRVAEVMATDAPSIVEQAVVPKYPASPSTSKNTILGGMMGLVLSVGVIVIRFMMDDTIKNAADVEKYLGINTLASIPLEYDAANRKKAKKKGIPKEAIHKSNSNNQQQSASRHISVPHHHGGHKK